MLVLVQILLFFAFPLANTGQAEYSCQMKESTVKWLLPLGQKWSPQDFRRFCTGHRTKQTIKFIYRRFNLCDLVLRALKLEHRIFSMDVPLLNFVILFSTLDQAQQRRNALVTAAGLIRESCIYSTELFVYQEVDWDPVGVYNRPCRSSNKPLSKNRCAITEHH